MFAPRLFAVSSTIALCAAMPAAAEMNFNRIAAFATPANMAEGEDRARETSSEIIAATEDGMMLVYTDSPLGVIGLVDIADPKAPKPLGNVAMQGEPTSVAVIGNTAFVGVNTSESYVAPSGRLAMVDLGSKAEVASCDLGGQPDSVARAKDGAFLAIAIENERDEELNDGALPQMPAGYVVKLPLKDGLADCDAMQKIDVTGLAAVAGDDPEPEFVDINAAGEIVVTMQENNEIIVIGADGAVANHFSAGSVTLEDVDTKKDGKIAFTGSLTDIPREPDAVKWIDADHFATANEGDWNGGSRGWTIFKKDGTVVYDSGNTFEYAVAEIGHFPDKRAGKKGVEPESVEFGIFHGQPLVFIGSERGSVVGVYDVSDLAAPKLLQLLPSGIGPEGYAAIPARNLLVSANETDLGADGAARAHVMLYERSDAPAAYPTITSAGAEEMIGWGALSGLVADAEKPGILYGVSDSFYSAAPSIFTVDASAKPARIVKATVVTRDGAPAQLMDLEGITLDGEGGFWLATEGRSDKMIPHGIVHVDENGKIKEQIGLPAELSANEVRFGFEGIAKVGDTLWMAVQREWKDDPAGMVKLVAYNTESGEWGAVRYPLEAKGAGWMGLSEITVQGDHAYIVERDNQLGDLAAVKKIFRVALAEMQPAALGGELPVVAKEEVRDLIPELKSFGGYVVDKVEGFAIDAAGEGFVVTDNDGVDDSSGETLFFSIGKLN
ncbi:esterase-like activity of phytase family protein [Sinirhodobacter sp. WL0062]|uniref:Esterase-like activity of phytase family protein n=1 Tax=Rhodobacter flavimaris TaxID=2907145 RepID=A0ABS8YXK8_9RHOB|nr:esterase-like activity of phytase family protein [Sinirhodobacter sp. WL0062]MCE5973491.1 esterase-like activity of phytase family protein [Sinirhodobacter sp. WL0062]